MTDFNEADHPRTKGKFSDKEQGTPEVAIRPPRKLGQLGGYEVKSFKQLSTGAFTATIWRDGKRALDVSNDGRGGPNRYDRPVTAKTKTETIEQARAQSLKTQAEVDAFRAMSVKALGDAYYEQEDMFLGMIQWNADIEKHAGRYSYTRESVVEDEIRRHEKEMGEPMAEAEQNLLRNPDILDE